MANQTIYPYGTDGLLPANVGIINDLVTGGVNKALSAEMGKNLNRLISEVEQKTDGIFSDIGLPDVNVRILFSITNNLTYCTTTNAAVSIEIGDDYETTVIANDGYDLYSVSVFVNDVDVTSDVYDGNGGILIENVGGAIVVVAKAIVHGVEVITFEDPIVEQIAYEKGWDDNGIFTTESLAAVKRVDTFFRGTNISKFNEFQYFTGIEYIAGNSQLMLGAFADCPNLESIVLPYNCKFYGATIFARCPKLKSIKVPDSVTTIPNGTFRYNSALETVDLGSGITSIGNLWIGSCVAVKTIICRATTPPSCDWSLFSGPSALEHIYVPASSVEAYKSDSNWANKAPIISAISE